MPVRPSEIKYLNFATDEFIAGVPSLVRIVSSLSAILLIITITLVWLPSGPWLGGADRPTNSQLAFRCPSFVYLARCEPVDISSVHCMSSIARTVQMSSSESKLMSRADRKVSSVVEVGRPGIDDTIYISWLVQRWSSMIGNHWSRDLGRELQSGAVYRREWKHDCCLWRNRTNKVIGMC